MVTTVQVKEETLKASQQIKGMKRLSSYDEVIEQHIKEAVKPGKSKYGEFGKKTLKAILEGLRDEKDRIKFCIHLSIYIA